MRDDFDDCITSAPRWNTWTRVQPVQFEDELGSAPRMVRLCCPAARVGDPVRIVDGRRETDGTITDVAHSILHVRRRA
jgi:hypothetical protein